MALKERLLLATCAVNELDKYRTMQGRIWALGCPAVALGEAQKLWEQAL